MSDVRWTDLHNHVIPGVDDGAGDAAEALAAVRALAAEGARRIVATPHLDGSLTADPPALKARLAELDGGWERLEEATSSEGVELGRGVELKLDTPEVDLTDPRLRLGGGSAVLVEFPFFRVPPRSERVLSKLRQEGYLPLLAHPERYEGLGGDLEAVSGWLDAGAFLQVNAASLHGRYGERAQAVARELLARGWVHCMASDYHARGRPRLASARALIEDWGGADQARLLFEENPTRLLNGERCLGVAPVQQPRSVRRVIRSMLPW